MPITPSLIIHGGAGEWPQESRQPALDGVRVAAELGRQWLAAGRTALDVAEQAARLLEDNPIFDAGRGGYMNTVGQVELDALIMDGATLANGAVAALRGVANPISVARMVMQHTPHALLVGQGAQDFARQMGVALVPEETLLAGEELERWQAWQLDPSKPLVTPTTQPTGTGTIGVVARDRDGNIAAATSTGGTKNKLPGRVGDSPLIGCGGYADNRLGGASATGIGEGLMKVVMSKTVCDLMAAGHTAQAAAEEAVQRLAADPVRSRGGVIAIDAQGRTGYAFNTGGMVCAYVQPDGAIVTVI